MSIAVTGALCLQLLTPIAFPRPAAATSPVSIRCSSTVTSAVADSGSTLFTISGTLLDASGNVVSDDNATGITFTNETPDLISERNAVQPNPRLAQSGIAAKDYFTLSTPGTARVSLSAPGLTGCAQEITLTAPGPAAKLVAGLSTGQPFYLPSISADGVSTSVLEIDVTDASNALVALDSSTQITITRTSGASVCNSAGSGTATATVSAGIAFFPITATTTAGTCGWTATSNTGLTPVSATLTTTSSTPQIAITRNTSPRPADGVSTLRVTVALDDSAGNPLTTPSIAAGVTVTASLGAGCNSANDSVNILKSNFPFPNGYPNAPYGSASYDGISGWAPSQRQTTPFNRTFGVNAFSGVNGISGGSPTGPLTLSQTNPPTNLVRFLFVSTFATTCTVTFSGSGTNPITANITFTALQSGAPATTPVAIRCAAAPSTTPADNGFTLITVTGTLIDAGGNVVADANATQIAFTNDTAAILIERNAVQPSPRLAQSGVASKDYLSLTIPGTAQVSLSASGLSGCSQQITLTPQGPATKLVAGASTGQPFYLPSISADGVSTSVLEVDVADVNDVPVVTDSSTQITITRTGGSSVCSSAGNASATAAVSGGVAFFPITATTTAGTCSWTATSNTGLTPVSATLTTSASSPQLVITRNTSPRVADGVSTLRVTVALNDSFGNPITTPATASATTVTASLGAGCSGAADSVQILAAGGAPNGYPNATYGSPSYDGTSGWPASKRQTSPLSRTFNFNGFSQVNGITGGSPTGTLTLTANNPPTNLVRFLFVSTFATTCAVTFTGSNTAPITASITFTALQSGGPGSTPPGTNVNVSPTDSTTGTQPVSVTYSSVTVAGNTTLTTSASGPVAPAGFSVQGTYYEIQTTAAFSGMIKVCIANSATPRPALFHYDGGTWVNVTNPAETTATQVCGDVPSLSPFALMVSAPDTTPPQLLAFSVTPTTVNTSTGTQTITFGARITDDISGFDYPNAGTDGGVISATSPSGQIHEALLRAGNRTTGDPLDGTYLTTMTLPQFSEQGTWALAVFLQDAAGNRTALNAGALAAAGFPSTFVQTGVQDATPPQLRALVVTPSAVDTMSSAQTISFTARITDDISGFDYPNTGADGGVISARSPSGQHVQEALLRAGNRTIGNALDGTYVTTMSLPQFAEAGTWTLTVFLQDAVGNRVAINTAALGTAGFPSSFAVAQAQTTPVTVTGPASLTHGSVASATATGGDGTGAYFFSVGASTGCTVSGSQVSVVNASGTCVLTAFRTGDTTYLDSAWSAPFTVALLKSSQDWSRKASLNAPRWDTGSGALNGIVYAVGGSAAYPDCTYTSILEAYDPATDSWTVKRSMPSNREGPGVAALGGLLYVTGGSNGCPGPMSVVEAYDPTTDTWTTKQPMPAPRHRNAAAALNGLLYVIGGESTCEATMVSYDPSTNAWTSRPSLAIVGFGCWNGALSMVAIGGRLYVLNWNGSSWNAASFDPSTNTWIAGGSTSGAPGCGYVRADAINGSVYVATNEGATGGTLTRVYDPVSGTWTLGPSQPLNTACEGVAAVGGTLYAFGGTTSPASCGAGDILTNGGATCIKNATWAFTPANRLAVTAPVSLTYGQTAALTTAGGKGSGAVSYDVGASTGCALSGTDLSVINASGTCTITATKAGDDNYNAATSAPFTVTLIEAAQIITVTQPAPSSASYLSSFNVAVTASSGLPVSITASGSCTGSGAGTTTISMTSGSGTCTVTYSQAGDNNYAAAPQITSTTIATPIAGLLVLNGTANGALTVSGGAKLTVKNTDLVVDSTSATGATASGGSVVSVSNGVIKTGSGKVSGSFSGTIVQGTVGDPLAGYPKPNTTGMTVGSTYIGTDGKTHYRPGVYSGITVSSTSAVLDSGLFILRGGGFTVSGGGSVTGASVMLFNTTASYPSGGSCGKIDLSGASTYNMTSPTANVYSDANGHAGGANMLIFQDPACTTTITLSGGSSAVASGTIYAPKAQLTISGGSGVLHVQIIVDKVTASGSATNVTLDPDRIASLP